MMHSRKILESEKLMKHRIRISFVVAALISMVLAGCSSRNGTVTIRIVATTDVHGCIFDKDLVTGEEREGSLAKVSSYLKEQRKEYKNVIYLDAGDILQGSIDVYQDVTAQFLRENLATQAYNILGCDAAVMGNHDFTVGASSYDRFFRSAHFPVLCANAYYESSGDFLPPYRIREKQGVRIAVLGLTTPVVNYSIPSDKMELNLADIVETAGYWVPILKEKEEADIVIGLIHSGYNNGRMDDQGVYENAVTRLVKEVPGFDIILYGHDHVARSRKMANCNGDSVLLLNPGPFAKNVATVTVTVAGIDQAVPVVDIQGELVNITGELPDRKFMKELSGWYDDVKNYADSVVGTVSQPLEANGVLWRNSSMVDWVHSIQMNFGGAQISLSSPVFTQPYIPSGNVQVKDLFKVYQFDNTMVSVMMSGSEIKNILEYSAGLFFNTVSDGNGGLLKMRHDAESGYNLPRQAFKNYITAAGVDYDIVVTKPVGERVKIKNMSDGSSFQPDKMYRTTINSFLYSSSESPVFRATDLKLRDMRERLNNSSMADIRFYMLTDLALRHEMDQSVKVKKITNWKLVPEDIVSGCLAKDTIGFNIIKTQTSNIW